MARPGKRNRFVTLWRGPQSPGDSDGFLEALSPSTAWVSMEPQESGTSEDTRSIFHRVEMRYHSQINMDSVLKYGDRQLLVRGFQNVGDANRDLVLLCEEVIA